MEEKLKLAEKFMDLLWLAKPGLKLKLIKSEEELADFLKRHYKEVTFDSNLGKEWFLAKASFEVLGETDRDKRFFAMDYGLISIGLMDAKEDDPFLMQCLKLFIDRNNLGA